MNTYEQGFRDAMGASGLTLERPTTIANQARATMAGSRLAKTRNFSGMSEDEVLSALGPIWIEFGRDYPKSLGLSLIRANIDPDDPEARRLAVKRIREIAESIG